MNGKGIEAGTLGRTDYINTRGKHSVKKTSGKTENIAPSNDAAAAYESSLDNKTTTYKPRKSQQNEAIVSKYKAQLDEKMTQMQSLVKKLFKKQGITIATANEMWSILASGNFTADADIIAKAKEDISETGYWGVAQTADRIFEFAKALSGGDESQMEKMKEAVEKGFNEAAKLWGGALPDISNDTYNAVMKKFDEFFQEESDITDSTAS